MRKHLALIVLTVVALGCGTDRTYTIADAEAAGFQKGDHQFFQMVQGATDGWGGTWHGGTVEVYTFRGPIPDAEREVMENSVQENNASGWAGMCEVGNLLVLYKSPATCEAIRSSLQ